ncbi:MAG: four helix bundle protein [Gemmatimonadaceae bacterium]|nr:four helix bundle protein [Gemmatimonadaceae bacterium]
MRRVPFRDRVSTLEQLERSIASIPANIAEGSGENSDPQFVRYIGHALASVAESKSHLAFLRGVGILPATSIVRWHSELREFTWMLYALRRRFQRPAPSRRPKSRVFREPVPPTLSRLPSPVSSLKGNQPSAKPVLSFPMPLVTVTRVLRFNAAHRVHNPALSDEENARLFGKCNNPNWHGHNYRLEVAVKGSIDERTGYVIDLGYLRDIVDREVIEKTDHRNFNIDVEYTHGIIPTTENIVVAMWRVIAPAVAPAQLVRLRLWETDQNYAEYEGD